jgi:hypothetical protein
MIQRGFLASESDGRVSASRVRPFTELLEVCSFSELLQLLSCFGNHDASLQPHFY